MMGRAQSSLMTLLQCSCYAGKVGCNVLTQPGFGMASSGGGQGLICSGYCAASVQGRHGIVCLPNPVVVLLLCGMGEDSRDLPVPIVAWLLCGESGAQCACLTWLWHGYCTR